MKQLIRLSMLCAASLGLVNVVNAQVPLPPTVTKTFSPNVATVGTPINLVFRITNPNPFPLTNVNFSDTIPFLVAAQSVTTGCGSFASSVGPGNSTTINSTNGTIGANSFCETPILFIVNASTVPGLYTNPSFQVTSTQAPAGTSAPTPFTVVGPPTMTKTFDDANIAIGGFTFLTVTIHNPTPFAFLNVTYSDNLPAGLVRDDPAPSVTGCGATLTSFPAAGTSFSFSSTSIPAMSDCIVKFRVRGVTPGVKVNTTSTAQGTFNEQPVTVPQATATVVVADPPGSFLIRYAANLSVPGGDSVINFTNAGGSSTPNGGALASAQNGEICANVYAYSPDEQLVSCCSCNVTPNALNSLSVKADLGTNTLTPIIPSALVIKVVASAGGASCNASTATITRLQLATGLLAWGTTIHALPVTAGTPATTYGVTETPFSLALLSDAELTRMTGLCAFIRANGSGYGICKSCKVGGLGGSVK